MKTIDLKGKRFGTVEVIEKDDVVITPSGQHKTMWICKCDCGNQFSSSSYRIRHSKYICTNCAIKSNAENRKKHGMVHKRPYNIWSNMRGRCNNNAHHAYKNYGQRGITVCEEWNNSFEKFWEWAKNNGYSDELTLDRIDNNKGYCPENCRWATRKEQANNTRRNKIICYNGKSQTLSQWADELGIDQDILGARLLRGVSFEDATKNI